MENTSVLAFCTYGRSTVAVRLEHDSKMDFLLKALWEKWQDLENVSSYITYSIEGTSNIFLDSDEDLCNMLCYHIQMKLNHVYIEVKVKNCSQNYTQPDTDNGMQLPLGNPVVAELSGVASCSNEERHMMSDKWSNLINHIGQRFQGGASEFRVQLCKYAIEHGFQFIYKKNDLVRVTAKCAADFCPWRVHASIEGSSSAFIIRTFVNKHSCGGGIRTMKHPQLNSSVVSNIISDEVRDKPLMRPKDILDEFRLNYGMDISYFHAWKGKEKALKEVHGDDILSFDQLRFFSESVLKSNPGSQVVVDYDQVTSRFKRFFIAYQACIHGFQFCRPMIFLDGTFLKGKYKGVLLSATGKDGNQGIYPLATGIVDADNEVNWVWFLQCLSECLNTERQITFISDRNKGLLEAVPVVFPKSFHGFCLQHLKQNLRERISVYKGNKYRERLVNLFTLCAYAPTLSGFFEKLSELRTEGDEHVEKFLQGLPFEHWANAYFKGSRYGKMCSNVAESFNSWIMDARHLPITQLLDHIRVQMMNMRVERLMNSKKWSTQLCPIMENILKETMKFGRHWKVSMSSENVFEVHSSPPVSVNLRDFHCDCRMWSIHGFPCSHALIVIQKIDESVYKYCDPCYSTAHFVESYSRPIVPVLGVNRQHLSLNSAVIKPPTTRKPPGRPRKRRIASFGQDKKLIRCSRCKKVRKHNRRSCKAPIED